MPAHIQVVVVVVIPDPWASLTSHASRHSESGSVSDRRLQLSDTRLTLSPSIVCPLLTCCGWTTTDSNYNALRPACQTLQQESITWSEPSYGLEPSRVCYRTTTVSWKCTSLARCKGNVMKLNTQAFTSLHTHAHTHTHTHTHTHMYAHIYAHTGKTYFSDFHIYQRKCQLKAFLPHKYLTHWGFIATVGLPLRKTQECWPQFHSIFYHLEKEE